MSLPTTLNHIPPPPEADWTQAYCAACDTLISLEYRFLGDQLAIWIGCSECHAGDHYIGHRTPPTTHNTPKWKVPSKPPKSRPTD